MKRFAWICCIMGAVLFLASAGFAQMNDQEVTSKGGKGVCKADIDKFCKGVKPGAGRIWTCLRSNEDRLSEACRARIAQVQEKGKEFRQACQGDVQKFCKEVPPGKGRIVSCLKSHEAELSNPCRIFFKK